MLRWKNLREAISCHVASPWRWSPTNVLSAEIWWMRRWRLERWLVKLHIYIYPYLLTRVVPGSIYRLNQIASQSFFGTVDRCTTLGQLFFSLWWTIAAQVNSQREDTLDCLRRAQNEVGSPPWDALLTVCCELSIGKQSDHGIHNQQCGRKCMEMPGNASISIHMSMIHP